jgi:putative colanic acid biosynthesis acetyltransferase WcaB
MMKVLSQDLVANQAGSIKSRLVLILFRFVQGCAALPGGLSILKLPARLIYQLIVEWFLGIEIPWNTEVGPGLRLLHGVALVVNAETVIGKNCTLRHCTTIGNKILADGTPSGSPRIGNNVEVGSNVVILGPVTIGDGVVIGAGAVVIKDIPPYSVVAGNPARIIRTIEIDSLNEESPLDAAELTSP